MKQYEMEKTACPLCDADDYQVFGRATDRFLVVEDAFTFVVCNRCGLVYQNPRVSPSSIAFFYPEQYFSSRPGRNVKQLEKARIISERKCDLVERFVPQRGKLLEIGSANGDFLATLQQRGWQVQGVEVSPDAVKFSQQEYNLDIFEGELLARPDNGERFDAIVMWAVLPHIHNPLPTVTWASELLKNTGKLLILCANIDSLAARVTGAQWGHLDLPRHYCMWSPNTLRKLYKKAGMSIDEIVHHDDIYNSNLALPGIRRIMRMQANGPNQFPRYLRFFARNLNHLLTKPLLAQARRRKQGGIITVIGSKHEFAQNQTRHRLRE